MIKLIYSKLYSHYGPQGWWPVTKSGVVPKYHKNIKLNEKQKLEICFGAILTQNTNWKNVEKAIVQLNKNNLIDINKILKINNKKLAKIIKSSGYHNQKAKKLKNLCLFLFNNYNGNINEFFNNEIKLLREKLLSINGIGPETADSMILYAAKKPIFVVDAYTKRIMNRIGFKEETYDELQELFMKNLSNDEKLFNEFHALFVELGKNHCKKKPLCGKCTINKNCNYYKTITKNKNQYI
tara:strand:- start:2744 stop:3460 length:717 start_codon:yes stop_codon:yes gene_type:complete